MHQRADNLIMRSGIASIWLITALLVVTPTYRAIGAKYLAALGLPAWVMYPACGAELVLALIVLGRPMARWIVGAQLVMVAFFVAVLAAVDPMLLAHPFGVLTKNVPLVALILAAHWHASEGVSPRVLTTLRLGVAAIWITEGVVPKLLLPQPREVALVARSPLTPFDPLLFLRLLGALEAAAGVATLLLRGRALRWLLWAELFGLVVLPILVVADDPLVLLHPFTPLWKNLPIIAATWMLARHAPGAMPAPAR